MNINNTHLMRMKQLTPYIEFGNHLQELRLRAGIKTQAELATLLKSVTQQSISRWEKGMSRPRSKDLPLLASALSVDVGELSRSSGHSPAIQTAACFDQPFPIDLLSPDSFERFCASLLTKLYPTAAVNRAGGSGHTQQGIDIEVTFDTGQIHTFQCKRHDQFGPAKVTKAITEHTRTSHKKVLLLSRVASPQTRDEVKKHPGWEMWDKDDVALKVRSLAKAEQLSLVDTFFQGQRLALLGETEAGPWLSVEDTFSGFLSKERAFNHLWQLVGRETELAELNQQLADQKVKAILITGSGGMGKSKLLFQAISEYEKSRTGVLIKVLSSTEELTTKHLESLGNGEKLLIVDDAHDRDDLPMLFHFTANPKNLARLVISLRTYGYERIKLQAASVSLQAPYATHISLKPLSIEQSTQLARQALSEYGGPEAASKEIANFTRECPLATVVAAQIVSDEKVHPGLLNTEEAFRTTLLSRFQDVITGKLANGKDRDSLTAILRIAALVQPLAPDDTSLLNLLEKIEGISEADSNRLLKLLISGGVLFKRGRMYRLAPDLLADYIIEQNCVTPTGSSSGYAERVFEAAPASLVEHVFLNLGKLDWRLSNGNTSSSRLLDGMWEKLKPTGDYGDTHFKAMSSVAYYQPERALQYAELSIREGKTLKDLPELIRHAAYNIEFVQRACACLWELGKSDARALHQHPQHAIRILKELCAVEPNKPVAYNEHVVRFALDLLNDPASWQGTYDPYDILSGILQTEGHTTNSNGREFSFSPYLVRQQAVSALRAMVVTEAIVRLSDNNLHVAISSAGILHEALRYPMGSFGTSVSDEDYKQWTVEFIETLNLIKEKVFSSNIDVLVWLELLNSISWHAKYSKADTRDVAKLIVSSIPNTLEFRTVRALYDGYGHLADGDEYTNRQAVWEPEIKSLANDLIRAFKTADELYSYLSAALEHIEKYKSNRNASPHVLMFTLLEFMPSLAPVIATRSLSGTTSPLSRFLPMAIPLIYQENVNDGRECVKNLLESGKQQLREMVAMGIGQSLTKTNLATEEIDVLRSLLTSKNERDVLLSVDAIRSVSATNPKLAISLILATNFCESPKVADEVLALMHSPHNLSVDSLDADTACAILDKLSTLPNLSEYWIEQFVSKLSAIFPIQTMAFFRRRVEHAASIEDYSFRPCNYGPYLHEPLKFRESSETDYLMRETWAWMRSHDETENVFHHFASHLFGTVFFPIDESVIVFFREKMTGGIVDLKLIGKSLREASNTFAFEHTGFVKDFLAVAKSHGSEIHEYATSALYCAAISGGRSGVPGQPFSRDVDASERAEAILKTLSNFSPAYRLYDLIRRDAKRNIDSSLREAEYLDD